MQVMRQQVRLGTRSFVLVWERILKLRCAIDQKVDLFTKAHTSHNLVFIMETGLEKLESQLECCHGYVKE